jgi:sulfoxide reductase heme-binding subunit YedZ
MSQVPTVAPAPKRRLSYWQRRIGAHLTIAVMTFGCTAMFWKLFSTRRDLIGHISIATAYPALFLTAVAVFLGPWNVLRRRANPVSFDLRRDIGIWAGIMALLHTVVGLNVHLRGRMWLYFVDQHHRLRRDWFGFGNDTGVLRHCCSCCCWLSRMIFRCAVWASEGGNHCSGGRTPL